MDIVKFKEKLLAFDFSNEMINATDLLKLNPDKKMATYLRRKSTKELIQALESDVQNSHITILETVIGNYKDGRTQGTWMHKTLAIDFAAWLSVEFRIFVYNTFEQAVKVMLAEHQEKIYDQQRQLDYFWDKEDQKDLYNR